jgi:flagellar biosynthesis protein FlhG
MPEVISVGSGKGGVGKSAVVASLAVVLARLGKRVIAADLDVGGANLHVMLGCPRPARTVGDWLARRVPQLDGVLEPVPFCRNLQLLPGMGASLASANPHVASRRRLLREIAKLDADVVLCDLGAGTNYVTLDFFLAADRQIAIATPDPASILDVYGLLKLASIRRVQVALGARSAAGKGLAHGEFTTLSAVIDAARETDPAAGEIAADVLRNWAPLLLLNRVSGTSRLNIAQLNRTLRQYAGSEVTLLGEVREDAAVATATRMFAPVTEVAPESTAGLALLEAARRLFGSPTARPAPALDAASVAATL